MSTGGIFTIVTNDGKQDRMLMATDLLKARLRRIMRARAAAGMDPTPTLVDIEKTHVLFMNAHFKPFAAIGFEYNKVRASAGTVTLDNTVQFSIPQFGDFFHDMVLHVRLAAVTASTTGYWRWCDYPGERLLEKVSFTVNGNPLDEYYSQDYAFFRQFELAPGKVSGYNRCAGQQEVTKARVIPQQQDAYNTAIDADNGAGGTAGTGADNDVFQAVANTANFWVDVTDGYQTPKLDTVHDDGGARFQRTDILEVTMPLLFWFNKDPRLAVPSVSIPFGQRFIEVQLAAFADLAQGLNIGDTQATTEWAASAVLNTPAVNVCELYVNNIFVNPEVHDIFIKRIGFNLIRVHRRQFNRVTGLATAGSNELLLSNFKWPIETIYFGFRDTENSTTDSTQRYLNGWHKFAKVESVTNGVTVGDDTNNAAIGTQYEKSMPLMQNVTFKAHGVPIYNNMPAVLFNQYMPLVFGERQQTPTDAGAYCVNFCLYPGVYQPSGHLNVSRAREFYVEFDNTVTAGTHRNLGTSSGNADFCGSAQALNFLLISDGSAVLRYST